MATLLENFDSYTVGTNLISQGNPAQVWGGLVASPGFFTPSPCGGNMLDLSNPGNTGNFQASIGSGKYLEAEFYLTGGTASLLVIAATFSSGGSSALATINAGSAPGYNPANWNSIKVTFYSVTNTYTLNINGNLSTGTIGNTSGNEDFNGLFIQPQNLTQQIQSAIDCISIKTSATNVVYPITTTVASTNVTCTTATLNGIIDDEGLSGWIQNFRYSTNATMTGFLTTGGATTTGTNTPTNYSFNLTGLTPNTTYYYQAESRDNVIPPQVNTPGAIMSFTTPVCPPVTTSVPITGITCPINYPVIYSGTTYNSQATLITALQAQFTGYTAVYNGTTCAFDLTGTTAFTGVTSIALSYPVITLPATADLNCATLSVTDTTATATGTVTGNGNEVNSGGGTVTTYLQYRKVGTLLWLQDGGQAISSTGTQPITSSVTGLQQLTNYEFRFRTVWNFPTAGESFSDVCTKSTTATPPPILTSCKKFTTVVSSTDTNAIDAIKNDGKCVCGTGEAVYAGVNFGISSPNVTGIGYSVSFTHKAKLLPPQGNPSIKVYIVNGTTDFLVDTIIPTLTDTDYTSSFNLPFAVTSQAEANNLKVKIIYTDSCFENISACFRYSTIETTCPEEEAPCCDSIVEAPPFKLARDLKENSKKIYFRDFKFGADNEGYRRNIEDIKTDGTVIISNSEYRDGYNDFEEVDFINARRISDDIVEAEITKRGIPQYAPFNEQTNLIKEHDEGSTVVFSRSAYWMSKHLFTPCNLPEMMDISCIIGNADTGNKGLVEIATPCEVYTGANSTDAELVVTTENFLGNKNIGVLNATGTGLSVVAIPASLSDCLLQEGTEATICFDNDIPAGGKIRWGSTDYDIYTSDSAIITAGQILANTCHNMLYTGGEWKLVSPFYPTIVSSANTSGKTIGIINGITFYETPTTFEPMVNGELQYDSELGLESVPLVSLDIGNGLKAGTDGKLFVSPSKCFQTYTNTYTETNTEPIVWVNSGNNTGTYNVATVTIQAPLTEPEAGFKWVAYMKAFAGMTATDPKQRFRLALHLDVNLTGGKYTIFGGYRNYVDNFPVSTGAPVYVRREEATEDYCEVNQTADTTVDIIFHGTVSNPITDPNGFADNQGTSDCGDGAPVWFFKYVLKQVSI